MRLLLRLLGVCALAGLLLWLFPSTLLPPIAHFLIRADEPAKSDCMLVLAGDFSGNRILRAGELYRQGFAPKVFVSGPAIIYDRSEDQLAIELAHNHGMTEIPFVGLKNQGLSTEHEAEVHHKHMQEAGCHSVIIVTSDFHTRRSGRIMRRNWTDMEIRVVAAPTPEFNADIWWTDRRYKKTLFMEWSKTIAEWLGV